MLLVPLGGMREAEDQRCTGRTSGATIGLTLIQRRTPEKLGVIATDLDTAPDLGEAQTRPPSDTACAAGGFGGRIVPYPLNHR